MITRCSERRISHHQTQDAITSASDAAVKVLGQGHFPAGHSVICDCLASDGKIKPENCENLNVLDSDGNLIARFASKEFQATQADDGSIVILRRSSVQKDSATKLTLHGLNRLHAEFYKRGDL